MKQTLQNVLAVQFVCPTTIAVGTPVEIKADLEVQQVGAGSIKYIGVVVVHLDGDPFCTVATSFRQRRDDRISGAAVAVGPFVYDATGKVIAYNPASHDAAAIAGVVIKSADAASKTVDTLEY